MKCEYRLTLFSDIKRNTLCLKVKVMNWDFYTIMVKKMRYKMI